MSLLVANCPRCGSQHITFDVRAELVVGIQYDWQQHYEVFCVCRNCHRATIFVLSLSEYRLRDNFYKPNGLVKYEDALNQFFRIEGFVSLRDQVSRTPPEHLPDEITKGFKEGAACLTIGCNNAAATMFRLCVDLATRPLLPEPADATKPQPNGKTRRDLGLRLQWLFDNGFLPPALRELAKCIREDANDGAHVGSLTPADAEDVADFTAALLERLFTEPKRLELAEQKRAERRAPKTSP
jgi:hypothetical protein